MHTLLFVMAAASLVWILVEHARLSRAVRRPVAPPPPPPRYPSLTVVRPVKGLDVGAKANVQALLDSEYPGPLEILFVFDDAQDPAVPLVSERLAAQRARRGRAAARLLFAGRPPRNRTGKLHAMALGVERARGELIAFSDSDTRVDRDLLRALVDRLLATPNAADVFAPAVADAPAHTAGDVGYALMLDAWYGAAALAAAGPRRQLPFIMGQLMVFRREALAAIGGVECAHGQLVDDMYLGRRVAAVGLRNVIAERPLHVINDALGAGDFLRLMRRWILFSRSGLPATLKRVGWLRGGAIWAALVAAVGALAAGWPGTAALAVAALGAVCASDRALHRALGGAPLPLRFAWVTVGIALLAPWVLISMRADHHVDWRGRAYALDGAARLDARAAP